MPLSYYLEVTMRLTSLLAKVDSIEAYCIGQATSQCSNVSGVDHSVDTIAAYQQALSELRTAISSYYSNSAARAERGRQLNVLIMTMYQTIVMSYMEADEDSPAFHSINEPLAPRGYNDFTELFDMGQAGDDLLAADDSTFFDGCILLPGGDIDVDLYTIFAAAESCRTAEAADSIAREALAAWLQSTNMKNSSIILFEEVTTSDNRPASYKQALGEALFIGRKALDVITYYDLDIRVPSYIS